uniref:Uncharacterized protein n=1 Tax=viral metagenome TaxID=1070528 RepID=A0A2V0RAM3_9ZZZZ
MNTITTTITQNDTLVIQQQSSLTLVRDAFLSIGLVFEHESFGNELAVQTAYQESEMTQTQRQTLRDIVMSGELFHSVEDLGTRVATFTINPLTGQSRGRLLSENARLTLMRNERVWDNTLSDVRSNAFLREQADMEDGRFTYRTLKGARFPTIVDRDMLSTLSSEESAGDYQSYTDFSNWMEPRSFKSYSLPSDVEYSTSADDSQAVYAQREVRLKFNTSTLDVKGHAVKRLVSYGYDCTEITLSSQVVTATISGGRCVPNWSQERPQLRNSQVRYKMTFELNDVDVMLSSNEKAKCKVIISAYIAPKIGKKKVSLSEYLSNGEEPLEIINPFVITVILLTVPGSDYRLRATGMPVIPAGVDFGDTSKPVAFIKSSSDDVNFDDMLNDFTNKLRRTDQWLNVRRQDIKEFCDRSPFFSSMYADEKYSHITKCGVEFADVEYIRETYPRLFSGLLSVGHTLMMNKINKGRSEADLSLTEIKRVWKYYFETSSGPSIVHSEDIRSPDEVAYGVKPVDESLLLVRIVLSRILIVGIGDVNTHDPNNPKTMPMSHHLLNQKRVEAMLIPLSVMQDGLLTYSVTGSVGKLLKDVTRNNLAGSTLFDIIKSSGVKRKDHLNIIDELTTQALFTVRAPILQVDQNNSAMGDLWFVSPSGMEFDVTPIANEICSKLSQETLFSEADRSVIAWHPLFSIIVGKTHREGGSFRYDVILLPAKRKSSMAVSYHNSTEVVRALDFNNEVKIHYATLRDGGGYLSALRTFIEDPNAMST